jgi:hypothetical protein
VLEDHRDQGGEVRRCNHALSLHGGRKSPGRCRTVGCRCPGWVSEEDAELEAVAL